VLTAECPLSFRIRDCRPDQIDEAGHDAQDQSNYCDPRSMQPVVESSAHEPAHDRSRGQDKSQLTDLSSLYPETFFRRMFVRQGTYPNLSDQFTASMKRSGKIPITTVANAVTASATFIPRLMCNRSLLAASRMNIALATRR
jgi:hypothetical protein